MSYSTTMSRTLCDPLSREKPRVFTYYMPLWYLFKTWPVAQFTTLLKQQTRFFHYYQSVYISSHCVFGLSFEYDNWHTRHICMWNGYIIVMYMGNIVFITNKIIILPYLWSRERLYSLTLPHFWSYIENVTE